ncbi:MAG: MFS transporter [Pseudomonadota bacterium]
MTINQSTAGSDAPRGTNASHLSSRDLGALLDGLPLNKRHWTVFIVCAIAFMFDSLDFQVLALIAPSLAKEWGLKPQVLGYLFSATAFGMLLGTYTFGILSDRFGRRPAFQITIAIFALSSGACAFAQDPTQLAILRFLTGIGIGGFIPVDTAVMSEYMPTKKRGRMIGLMAIFFPVGGLAAAWLASLIIPTWGWRALFLVGVIPAIMILVVRYAIPETPRFLISRGKLDQARKSIGWIAMGSLQQQLSGTIIASLEKPSAHFSVLELFRAPYLQRTILTWAIWFFWSFSYFGIILWMPTLLVQFKGVSPVQVFGFIAGFMISGIAGRIVVAMVVDQIGRKPILIGCGFFAAIFMLMFGQQTTFTGLLIFGYLTAFFHDGGFGAIAPYTPELYPTRARATGVGWANGAGRIASILSPIAVGYLVSGGLQMVFLSFAASYALCAVVMLLIGVETKGLGLEEAALE